MQGLPEQPQWLSKWQLNTSEWNQLGAALVTAVVLVLPICLYVPLYQDDFERPVNGMHSWAGDGRPLSDRDRDDNTGALRSIGSSALMDVAFQGRRLQVMFKAPEVNP